MCLKDWVDVEKGWKVLSMAHVGGGGHLLRWLVRFKGVLVFSKSRFHRALLYGIFEPAEFVQSHC